MKKIRLMIVLIVLVLIILGIRSIWFVNPDKEEACGIENCHGLEIDCGPNIPDFCTEIYMLGDFCRQYATCEIVWGNCQLVENLKFNRCKSCVEKCIDNFEGSEVFQCEEDCREKLSK